MKTLKMPFILEKEKLNDGTYEYFVGIDRLGCADEIKTEKTTVFVYADYYQFRCCPTQLIFSVEKMHGYRGPNGDLTLCTTVTMWRKGINIFCNDKIV